MIRKLCYLLSFSLIIAGCNAGSDFSSTSLPEEPATPARPVPPQKNPTEIHTDENEAINFYSNGSLINPTELAPEGPGFIKLFTSRNRAFSTFDFVNMIEEISSEIRDLFPKGERLQLGDMSNHDGGSIGSHLSHQNGLDADIAYYRTDYKEQSKDTNGFAINFVNNGVVSNLFDTERNWILINKFIETNRIERMFVDQAIKVKLCDYAKTIGEFETKKETLRKLRIWPNHYDHVHVRITCPKSSPACIPQDNPIPSGQGCDFTNGMNALDVANEVAP